jgi:cytidyltransferase-like protein
MGKKVFVTGCFDMLHSGHVAFLQEAASFGTLYVCLGSDQNIMSLKGRVPSYTQEERRYMLNALRCVGECRINSGMGIIDFLNELDDIKPDVFVVNEDGHTPAKAALCRERGIEYKILSRVPFEGLPRRSTTALRAGICNMPFRIDLAGGWLDQPFVSKFHPGPVVTICIEPTVNFNHRSGMASSTRNKAIELWKIDIPRGDREQLAKMLFSYENPPGTVEVAGSQDALGIVMPGLNKLNYAGSYWPQSLESIHDNEVLSWVESRIALVSLEPRVGSYVVTKETRINAENAKRLADAAENCWRAITARDAAGFGRAVRESFAAQIVMFPNMVNDSILRAIDEYKDKALGWKLSGAGGGGYIILIAEQPVPNAIRVKIRRRDLL